MPFTQILQIKFKYRIKLSLMAGFIIESESNHFVTIAKNKVHTVGFMTGRWQYFKRI